MFQRILWCISLSVSLCICSPGFSIASDNILFVLDASGSMWEKVDGTIKMTTAKQTLGQLLKDIPATKSGKIQ
jgi:hypothetical protein